MRVRRAGGCHRRHVYPCRRRNAALLRNGPHFHNALIRAFNSFVGFTGRQLPHRRCQGGACRCACPAVRPGDAIWRRRAVGSLGAHPYGARPHLRVKCLSVTSGRSARRRGTHSGVGHRSQKMAADEAPSQSPSPALSPRAQSPPAALQPIETPCQRFRPFLSTHQPSAFPSPLALPPSHVAQASQPAARAAARRAGSRPGQSRRRAGGDAGRRRRAHPVG